jgi:hypothetical protein
MVQLLTEFEKLVSVLLYRYARAKVLNAFTFGLVHAPESIAASAILSMFDVERKSKFCTGPMVQQDSAITVQQYRLPSISLRFESVEVRLPASVRSRDSSGSCDFENEPDNQ